MEFLSHITLGFLKGFAFGLLLGAVGRFFLLRFLTASHKDLAELKGRNATFLA